MAEKFEQLLSPAEAAEALGVHVKTVSAWARAGRLPCVFTLGRHRRFKVSVIEAVRDGHGVGGPA